MSCMGVIWWTWLAEARASVPLPKYKISTKVLLHNLHLTKTIMSSTHVPAVALVKLMRLSLVRKGELVCQ